MSSSSSSSSSSEDEGKKRKAAKTDDAESKKAKKEKGLEVLPSDSDDSSDDSSSSSSSDKKKKKKKAKKKAKKKEKKKAKKEKAKKVKKGKKAKKDKNTPGSVSNQFGKYGILKQEDIHNKKPEFLLWAMEVQKINTDTMGQMQLRDLFKEFVEDYNTATMPHKKYYNLNAYESAQMAKNRGKKKDEMTAEMKRALASFDDERARREEMNLVKLKKQEQTITDEVQRMRKDKSKVDDMRSQEFSKTQVAMLNKSGHAKEAAKLVDKMK
mmetsp:Transcript_2181/g.5549  ORF Transcript_2181/g.5549 Transcript_2181/m.5549 type:complete len:268 (+) Transcript_2181:61-864(+)